MTTTKRSYVPRTFYTTGQVAKMAGVSTQTVVNWSLAGKLETWWSAGGHRRIPARAVNSLLRKMR